MTLLIKDVNLKVLLMDTDYFALHAVNGFLAWDRRTRVTHLCESLGEMWAYLSRTPLAEQPDVVLLECDHIGTPDQVRGVVTRLRQQIKGVRVVCVAQMADPHLVQAVAEAGGAAYLLKQDVRLQVAWAIAYALEHDFVITKGVAKACQDIFHTRIFHATVLPGMREFPELTGRVAQALKLCVLDGLPAHLAADEMGISLHTIRGYVKDGYRILEAHDDTEYPEAMTAQERAFMRLTAFAEDHDEASVNGQRSEDD
jgi:DNA-binding NarL/FixJ family response regulator